jgi:hypothetical protein
MAAAHCYRPGCRGFDYMAADPAKHLGEYLTVTALADVDPEDFIAAVHEADPSDDFPAACFDPAERRGRRRAGDAA